MKTNKLFLIFVGFLFVVSALQLTSACKHNEYDDLDNNYDLKNGDDVIFIIRDTEDYNNYGSRYWENEDRFPVYDYRYGYSYRAEKEYREDLNKKIYKNTYIEHDSYYSRYDSSRRVNLQEEPEYYYSYDDYMRTYTKHECYSNPPADKLIYVKCP